MKYIKTTLFLLLSLLFFTAQSQDTINTQNTENLRPRVGLVLSGGGAKGFAHIGVLKVLEEAGIHVDYISGTSMGSIIGGLYAAGYSPEQLTTIVKNNDWKKITQDNIPRRYIPIEQHLHANPYLVTFPILNHRLVVKPAVHEGQMVANVLTRYTNHISHITNFDSLPVPFLCVGTDLETGKPYYMRRGNLARSIRASMAIPLYYNPIEVDNVLLVDGGLCDNFPVDAVRNMGADIVIGIDVQMPLATKETLNSSPAIANQLIGLLGMETYERQLRHCDIYIHPDLHDAGTLSFELSDEIIGYGEDAARQYLPLFKRLAEKIDSIGGPAPERPHIEVIDSLYVSDIIVPQDDKQNARNWYRKYQKKLPGMMTINEIDDLVFRLYTSDYYHNIWYTIEHDSLTNTNNIKLSYDRTTNETVSLGAHYDSDYGLGVLVNFQLRNFLFRRFNHYFSADIYAAENPFAKIDLQFARSHILRFGLEMKAQLLSFDKYYKDNISNSYEWQDNYAALYSCLYLGDYHRIRFGIKESYSRYSDKIKISTNSIFGAPDNSYDFYYTAFFNYLFDNKEKPTYATRGLHGEVMASLIGENDFDITPAVRIQGSFDAFIPVFKKHTLNLGVVGGLRIFSTPLPWHQKFFLGGQSEMRFFENIIPFTGFRFSQETYEHIAIAQASWHYDFLKTFYLVGRCDGGFFSNDYEHWLDDFKIGYGASLGWRTLLGPIEASVMKSNIDNSVTFFITAGYSF